MRAAQATGRTLPRAVWALGLTSLLMDTSSELIHGLLPVFLVVTLGTSATAKLFGKAGWMTVGFPVIDSSRSTTAGSVS